jgi:acetate kinase
MREVLARADAGEAAAQLALGVYVHRLRGGIAAMTAALGGLDALVFTGGVGERSAEIRTWAAAGLEFLGVEIDEERNADGTADREISSATARARTLVVHAREDLEIARQTRALVAA